MTLGAVTAAGTGKLEINSSRSNGPFSRGLERTEHQLTFGLKLEGRGLLDDPHGLAEDEEHAPNAHFVAGSAGGDSEHGSGPDRNRVRHYDWPGTEQRGRGQQHPQRRDWHNVSRKQERNEGTPGCDS